MVGGLVLKPKTTNEGKTTMTRPKLKDDTVTLSKQELMKLLTEEGALKGALQVILQEVLECEMEQSLQAAKGGAHRRATGLPQRLLRAQPDHTGGQAGAAGAAGPAGPVLDRAVCPLPTQ
jgi:hypothetical protein